MTIDVETTAPEQTEAIGRLLAEVLPPGTLVALYGDLATGKTCLVRGMAGFLGGDTPVHSPTFTLVNQYGDERPLYHLDLYRLGGPDMLADLGYEEIFDGAGLCVVEWAERAEGLLPAEHLAIYLSHGGGDIRKFAIEPHGLALPAEFAARLKA
ncbi:MAG: tRNA (adenosine(37)-N6)-threonylcarbamoyltransferase complex ATPase subunit type 1 TsaE, partial [Gammaproteobacteria bacterium]|nr:tRNA (adenosine(37)-N6)-threonylcarbamoyltransferase complex ATPase subunit type 1 TsaE [Gammaproteobacteria bacterium]